ncbi:MAG: hypothetical protein JXA06_09350 [Bacteroidetes bacterium]|nr:hypothetical protein [Bacteroidota bacterium]
MQETSILVNLLGRIRQVRDKQNRVNLLCNTLVFLTWITAAAAFLFIAEAVFGFSSSARTVIFIISVLLIVFTGSWMVVRPFLQFIGIMPSIADDKTAVMIGEFFPSIKDRLLNFLQLAKSAGSGTMFYSKELADAALENFAEEINSLNFSDSVKTNHLSRKYKQLGAVIGMMIVLFLLFPDAISGAAGRLIHFKQEYLQPPRYQINLFPGDREILKGENADIKAEIKTLIPVFNSHPDEITFFRQQEGQDNFEEIRVKSDSGGIFNTTFQTVRTTTKYYAQYADAESRHHVLTVFDRPLIRSFRIRLDYPAYTKIPARLLDEYIGDVEALQGTRVTVTGTASKNLKEGVIHFGDKNKLMLSTKRDKFSASFTLSGDNSYSIHVTDEQGLSNADPVIYRLSAAADEFPSVEIIEPGRNMDIAENREIQLVLRAKDDFGFSAMRLGHRLVRSRYTQADSQYTYTEIPFSADDTEIEVYYKWNLSGFSLVPEDVLEYFAEVYDNDAINSPKIGKSKVYLIRLPSLEEFFADINQGHEKSVEDLKQSFEHTKRLEEDIESINRDLKKEKNPDWQTQKKMEEIENQFKEVQRKLDDVQSRIEQMTQQMQQQNVLSKQTMEKYMELQQLFQQFDVSEMQKMLMKLQQQMPNFSREQMQEAMKELKFSEEHIREGIERTLNLLKRLMIERKIDEIKKRAQELEKAEEHLAEEAMRQSESEVERQKLAERQADLINSEQAMEREAADLKNKMEEFFTEMPVDKMQESLDQLRNGHLDQKIQQASDHMRAGNMKQAQQIQQQIADRLGQFSRQMNAMQQQMLEQQSQFVINEMRRAVNNLLELSKDEEELKQRSKQLANSPQLRESAQDQQRIVKDLNNVITDLNELSKKTFIVTPEMGQTIGEALMHMNSSVQMLSDRNGVQASKEQESAMSSLNLAAIQMQDVMQSMMQGGSGEGAGSLMQQLRMIAERQLSVNMQTRQMGGMSQQQAAEAARLAREQAAIQKSLEELNSEAQQTGEKKRILGDLKKIAEEMEEVARNLEQNKVDPETTRKQERILSRLLDASKSTRERDYEKKRKAETGTQIARKSPKDMDWDSLEKTGSLREELSKALEQGYTKDYQVLIRKYFEKLEKTEKSVY